jgi:hypothetical protein
MCPEPWVKGKVILARPIDSGAPSPRETRFRMTMVGGPETSLRLSYRAAPATCVFTNCSAALASSGCEK